MSPLRPFTHHHLRQSASPWKRWAHPRWELWSTVLMPSWKSGKLRRRTAKLHRNWWYAIQLEASVSSSTPILGLSEQDHWSLFFLTVTVTQTHYSYDLIVRSGSHPLYRV